MNHESPKDLRIRKPCIARISIKSQAKQVGEEVVDLTGSNLMVTLGPQEAQSDGWKVSLLEKFVVALVVLFAMALVGYALGQDQMETEYLPILEQLTEQVRDQKTTIDERNEQIAHQSTALEVNQGQLERYAQRVAQLEERLRPLDENGVRRDRMFEFYGDHDPELEPDFVTDAEFRLYCQEKQPGAVLPTNEWTVESVLNSWQATPEVWGYYDGGGGRCHVFFTWTPNYQHCFILDSDEPFLWDAEQEHEELISGWLVVDGIRVAMFDQETYDIEDPLELVRQYQSGEWDGSIRRSHDGSTTVRLSAYSGTLYYSYAAYHYDEHFDPNGTAWQQFAKRPWWWAEDLPADTLKLLGLPENWAPKPEIIINQPCRAWLDTKIYVDLPASSLLANDVVEVRKADNQLFCLKMTQVQLFSKGKLLEEWDLSKLSLIYHAKDSELLLAFQHPTKEYAQDIAYVRIGKQLIALRKGGELAVVLEKIEQSDSFARDELFGFSEGRLISWPLHNYHQSETLPVVLAEDVLDLDFSKLALFTTADGCFMLTYDDHYNIVVEYLGTEPMQSYADYFEKLRGSWRVAS